MSLGAIVVFAAWLSAIIRGLFQPWYVAVALAGWIALVPKWNWRYGGLPELEYQNYLFLVLCLANLISAQRISQIKIKPFLFLVAYLIISWVSSFQTLNPEKTSFFLDTFYKILLMQFLICHSITNSRHIKMLLVVLILSQGWNAFNINQLYYQYGLNVRYFRWNYLDNNTYSISSVPILALSLSAALLATDRRLRVLGLVVAILQAHTIMILASRGTMLAGMFLIIVSYYFAPKSRSTRNTALIVVILGGLLAGPSVTREFMSSFESTETRDSSATSRFYLWQAGWEITKDYPLLGAGPWAGDMLVPQYGDGNLGGERKALHNIFFEATTGSGIPATICYFAFYWIPTRKCYHLLKHKKKTLPNWMLLICHATITGVPAYLIASCFSAGIMIENIYLLLGLAIATIAYYTEFENNRAKDLIVID